MNVLYCRKKKRSPSQATEAGASLAASSQRQRSVRRGKSVRQVLPHKPTKANKGPQRPANKADKGPIPKVSLFLSCR